MKKTIDERADIQQKEESIMPTNGIKLLTGIFSLAEKRPITAIILALIVLAIFTGGGSFIGSFWGQDSAVTKALADLENKNTYLASAIKQEEKDRIREITQLKEDEKLLSKDSIRLMIKKELEDFEDRLVARLK